MQERIEGATWCILRTNGARTLLLADSLRTAGIDAWTPVRVIMQQVPRSKVKRERTVPIMPTFVFARAGHLPDLRGCLAMPVNPHPPFSIFRYDGRVPLISDRSLDALRSEEQRERPKAQRAVFPALSRVRAPEGAFGGMSGIVEQSDGKTTLVCFGGWMNVKIDTFLLFEDGVEGEQPAMAGNAAQAAVAR